MGTDAALLRLLTWFSASFPTGAFAHSHGIEQAVEDGDLRSEADTLAWIATLFRQGAPRGDAILLRHAHAADDVEAVVALAALAAALPPTRELREETLAQGDAFARAALPWSSPLLAGAAARLGDARLAHPVAAGVLTRAHDVDAETATLAFLHGFAASLVSAALRLVPLGQNAALRVQHALEPVILAAASATRGAGLDALGSSCFRSDVASMRHETQRVRLFRT